MFPGDFPHHDHCRLNPAREERGALPNEGRSFNGTLPKLNREKQADCTWHSCTGIRKEVRDGAPPGGLDPEKKKRKGRKEDEK